MSMNFYDSWEYLNSLEAVYVNGINRIDRALDIEVVKVNPLTNEIDNNELLNTKVEVWLEFGKVEFDEDMKCVVAWHDYDLDCGGNTFEEAIIELAELCKKHGYKERK